MPCKFVEFVRVLKAQYDREYIQSIDPESIKRIRENSGLGRLPFAQLIGTYEERVRRWEQGTASPSVEQIVMLRELQTKFKNNRRPLT